MIGAGAGLIWANVSLDSYGSAAHALEFIVNDVGMVFFFGLAAKEVYEAMLPGGPLSSPREGAVPVFAAVGGMLAPASIYLAAIWFLGRPDLTRVGRSRARPTSHSRTWSLARSSSQAIRPFRSCSCWRLPMTPWA
jgi:NhaA family Na+:H+ antiporter